MESACILNKIVYCFFDMIYKIKHYFILCPN
jgi:hypothetical protein